MLTRLRYLGLTLFFALISSTVARANPPAVPIALSNPDGQALNLEKLDIRVATHGCLSLVEMEMVFRNPQAREIEGRFLCLLPDGAAICRFAKEVNGSLMEGEVVERLQAQEIFNAILPTMRDPALLEYDQGNRFSVRVYPIPASGTVRLLLAYSQLLPLVKNERKLRIPLAGLPRVGAFSFSVQGRTLPREKATLYAQDTPQTPAGDNLASLSFHATNFKPERDLELTLSLEPEPGKPAERVSAFTGRNVQMLCYRPALPPTAASEPVRDWTLYIDTSASTADVEDFRLHALTALAGKLRETKRPLRAFAFDLDVAALPQGDLEAALRTRHSLGSTNLARALQHVGDLARATREPQCFVLITDGIATAGPREVGKLLDALGKWPERHVLHALTIGMKRDSNVLNTLVEKTNGRMLQLPVVETSELLITKLVGDLRRPLGPVFEFFDAGAWWQFPSIFRDVQPGDELVVFSAPRYDGASKAMVLQRAAMSVPQASGVTGTPRALDFKPEALAEFGPLLKRERDRALLARLELLEGSTTDAARRKLLHDTRIAISRNSRVLCPLTALLVLETEADYANNGIPRDARSDVLAIGNQGIEVKTLVDAETAKLIAEALKPINAREDAIAAREKARDEAKARALQELADEKKRLLDELEKGKATDFGVPDESGSKTAKAPPRLPNNPQLSFNPEVMALGAPQIPMATFTVPKMAILPGESTAGSPAKTVEKKADDYRPAAANLEVAEDIQVEAVQTSFEGWQKQYGVKPSDSELAELRTKVAAKPRNRTLRNTLAEALRCAEKWPELKALALEWQPFDPENPQVYEFLGASCAKLNDLPTAVRAFTSIAEIAPNRAALLARSGWLLMTVGKHDLAAEYFREAIKNRPDDANHYRGLALTFWMQKKYKEAAAVLEDALQNGTNYRAPHATEIMREELRLLLQQLKTELPPSEQAALKARADGLDIDLKRKDALRVTLCWETDATDVDLHVSAPNNEECFNDRTQTDSGLSLIVPGLMGLGPKVIHTEKTLSGTYHLGVGYVRTGPMGISRGVVVVVQSANGVPELPTVIPFAVIPGDRIMWHLGVVKF